MCQGGEGKTTKDSLERQGQKPPTRGEEPGNMGGDLNCVSTEEKLREISPAPAKPRKEIGGTTCIDKPNRGQNVVIKRMQNSGGTRSGKAPGRGGGRG